MRSINTENTIGRCQDLAAHATSQCSDADMIRQGRLWQYVTASAGPVEIGLQLYSVCSAAEYDSVAGN
jgi:hypothetical protein